MNTKNNQQFRRSQDLMEKALLTLLNDPKKPKITVSAIVKQAGINRSTFYAHYLDLPDMLDKTESKLRQDLMADYPHSVPLSEPSFVPFLNFIKKHRDFYVAILKTRTTFPLRTEQEQLFSLVIDPLCEKNGMKDEDVYVLIAFQSAFTMILRYWVENGCQESPEEMARTIYQTLPACLQQ
ncbi:TetR-like C-terminal domain-containing protein [Lactobacillus sp.]|uniref:TetR-like C-terminal domain-containing protein n=1 Tax=Lactobacillus sp. TaxID=1591 RepID=UPI003F02059B